MNSIGIELAGFSSLYEHVPVVIGPVCFGIQGYDLRGSWIILAVEEQQVHADSIARENAEVNATVNDGCADGCALAYRHAPRCFHSCESGVGECCGIPQP